MANRFTTLLDTTWQSIKLSYSFSSIGDFRGAFSVLNAITQRIMNFLGFGFSISEIFTLLRRKDLKPRQKILPIIGYAFAGLASLITGLIVCILGTVFLPPLIFAGAVANIVRSVGLYFLRRAEKRNLREFIEESKKNLKEKIAHLDSPRLKADIETIMDYSHFQANEIQDLFVRIGNDFINRTADDQEAMSNLIKQLPLLSEKEKIIKSKEINDKSKALKERFKEENKALFELLEKKQRLHFLEKFGDLGNIGFSIAAAVLSLLTWIVPLTIAATPAAPFAPLINYFISGISIGLASTSAIFAVNRSISEVQIASKVVAPKEKISSAVFPIPSESKNKAPTQKQSVVANENVEKENIKPKEKSHKYKKITHHYSGKKRKKSEKPEDSLELIKSEKEEAKSSKPTKDS